MSIDQGDDLAAGGLFAGADRVRSFADPPIMKITRHATSAEAAASLLAQASAAPSEVVTEAPDGSADPAIDTSPATEPSAEAANLAAARQRLREQQAAQVDQAASWGASGVLARATGGLVKPKANRAEREFRADVDAIRRFAWPGPFAILVANKKGGVGKTTASLVLAGILANLRGGGVLALETSEAAGTLSMRAEAAAGQDVRGLAELLTNLSEVRSAAHLAWFTQAQSSGAAVIGSVDDRVTLEGGHVALLRELVDQYYPLLVLDTGNDPESEAFTTALSGQPDPRLGAVTPGADQLVVPVTLTPSAVTGALDVLARVLTSGPDGERLVASAVVLVLPAAYPTDKATTTVLREVINDLGVAHVIELPFDEHLGTDGAISVGRLSPASQKAWTHAAAAVLTAAAHRKNTNRK